MPQASDRMLGFQLWLNLSRGEKMTEPAYLSITRERIPVIKKDKAAIHVLSGRFEETAGVMPSHIPAAIYDVELSDGEIEIPTKPKSDLRFIFFSGKPLSEPIAWGGPIVVNTREELERAFDELQRGTFVKHN